MSAVITFGFAILRSVFPHVIESTSNLRVVSQVGNLMSHTAHLAFKDPDRVLVVTGTTTTFTSLHRLSKSRFRQGGDKEPHHFVYSLIRYPIGLHQMEDAVHKRSSGGSTVVDLIDVGVRIYGLRVSTLSD